MILDSKEKKESGKIVPIWEFFFSQLEKIFTFLERSREGFDQTALVNVGRSDTGFMVLPGLMEMAGGTGTVENLFH